MTKLDFGTFVLGGNVFGWTVEREEGFRILDAFVERGGRMIDTADAYPPGGEGGGSEAMIGEWLASRGQRDRIAIATKVAKWPQQRGLSAANIASAVEGSLRRLRTDHIDVYYAHEDDTSVDQAEYVAAFDRLVREGKVLAVGASNFTPERLQSALAIARANNLCGFSISQDHWNLVERNVERTLVPVIEREGLKELPYFALASGFLTGKYRSEADSVDKARQPYVAEFLTPRNFRILEVVEDVARETGAGNVAVALAWLMAQPTVTAPIASATRTGHVEQMLAGLELTLSADQLARLDDVSTLALAADGGA